MALPTPARALQLPNAPRGDVHRHHRHPAHGIGGLSPNHQVAKSIIRGVDFVLSDTWLETTAEFRNTSCPASYAKPAEMILPGIAAALCAGPAARLGPLLPDSA